MHIVFSFIGNILFYLIILFLSMAFVRKNKDGVVLVSKKLRQYASAELIAIILLCGVFRVLVILMTLGK